MKKYILPVGIIIVALVAGGLFYINSVNDGDNTKQDNSSQTAKEKSVDKSKKSNDTKKDKTSTDGAKADIKKQGDASISYTAQAGDSYTVLARDAIQTYAKGHDKKLSKAQIVAAETFVTQDAGSPYLNLGQTVEFKDDVIAQVVKKAQGLSDNEITAWQTYVPYVDFSMTRG